MSNEYAEAYKARQQEDRITPALASAKKASEPGDVKKPFLHDDVVEKAIQKTSTPIAEELTER